MSWLNSSFNTIKGQLTTLAQEVLAETAGPGDEEYRGPTTPEDEAKTAIELLAETQKEKDDMYKVCTEQESKIAQLNKQIIELQSKVNERGAGVALAAVGTSSHTSKSSSENNGNLEDSWCWETDNPKSEQDRSSESSSGNGNEMVNITLEEVPLGAFAKSTKQSATIEQLQKRIKDLTEERDQLNVSLDELDSQHNLAMQNVLELKTDLQGKLTAVTRDYEALKKEHADKFINSELELGKLKNRIDTLEKERSQKDIEYQKAQENIERYSVDLRKAVEELADLQSLLHKRDEDNLELIERIKMADQSNSEITDERDELLQKIEQLTKEMDELKKPKEKKTSESSSSKQSEDEFIVVREGDTTSSGPTTPPTKEELRDKIVALENRVSELTLENGSLSLKLQDREMEKELSVSVLKENIQSLQEKCEEYEVKLKLADEERNEQQETMRELKDRAADAVISQEKLKALTDEKQQIEAEIEKMKKAVDTTVELQKRLLFSEQEKEHLQIELQTLRSAQDKISELESKVQNLILENQELKLNQEAESEIVTNTAELEIKLKNLTEENESMRLELENIAAEKFRAAIEEAKQEITDLDADDEELFNMENLKELINTYATDNLGDDVRETVEKTYKVLRERLSKLHLWERSVAQLSEEIIDLKNNKLMWDHEKKTLEADISQYILQCDELMKNNEILLNELENYKRNKLETIPEHNEENILLLETQLEECSKLNRTLESEYAELNEKLEELDREKQDLTEKLRDTQQRNKDLSQAKKNLELQCENLELEKSNLLFELNELKSNEDRDEINYDALRASEGKCEDLSSQLTRLSRDHSDLVAALQTQKAALGDAIKKREDLEEELSAQKSSNLKLTEELSLLQVSQHKKDDEKVQSLQDALTSLKQELVAKDIIAESLKGELKLMRTKVDEIATLNEAKTAMQTELNSLQAKLENMDLQLSQKSAKESEMKTEIEKLLKERENLIPIAELDELRTASEALHQQLEALRQSHASQTAELQALQEACSSQDQSEMTQVKAQATELQSQLMATSELQKSVEQLMYEKNEMIKGLQQKHSENMQYYAEIQRLQSLVHQLQQDVHTAIQKPCEKCATNEECVKELRKEQEKLRDQVTFLREKSDILTTNLITEQANQKLAAQEKAEVEAQNATIRKDLERLRQHLLEIEDLHTRETMEMQHELEETKMKMEALQTEVAQSSNAYTSASIRANQHAETLQAQYSLLIQQRDELVTKLSLAEDRDSKNQAALCNLQCALEQFQNDRENDIKAATQRMRKDLQKQMEREGQLQKEMATLNQQLTEANQGLNAAARLSDQLEAAQLTIAALREEVDTLKQQNTTLETKLANSESSQSDKIDKSLIKSLLIGYIVSNNPNDKNQVLRMISSVLDFNQNESDKVGLNKQQSSWLSAIIGGAGGASGANDNLVQAFVQFLEQESQPKTNANDLPNLLNIAMTNQTTDPTQQSAASTRKMSVSSGTSATPLPIQPLMLSSDVLNEFAPTRNSSSILKDILNDS